MSEEIRHPDGRIEHPSVRFEPTDASLGWILSLIAIAVVVGLAAYLGVLFFFNASRDSLAESRKSQYPLAAANRGLPPEPRLEQLDRLSVMPSVNANADQQVRLDYLHRYGATEDKDFVHIPIERAMALLANKLPARGDAAARSRMACTLVLLCSPPGPGPLLAATASFLTRDEEAQSDRQRRQNGLVDGGEPNSGRMFNPRKLP